MQADRRGLESSVAAGRSYVSVVCFFRESVQEGTASGRRLALDGVSCFGLS